jgi:two-component system chemotaxis sensor kinase CheA
VSETEQDEIVTEFVVEANENLDLLDRELMGLEKNPNTPGLLATVFRRVHTVKGACGFIGFSKLEAVAHVAENLLSKLRDEEIELSPAIVTALLATADTMREILSGIAADGQEREHDCSALIATLDRLQSPAPEAPAPPAAAASPSAPWPVAAPAPVKAARSGRPPPSARRRPRRRSRARPPRRTPPTCGSTWRCSTN